MSTAELERLEDIRDELETISNMLGVLYTAALFAAVLLLWRASGVSVSWLKSS